jgi:hypothetical protein
VSVVAAVRPDAWDFPLLLHVLGAMVLVGALVLAGSALVLAWRDGNPALLRLGYRSLLLGVLPGWVVMRGAAEWIASKEDVADANLSWVEIGYNTADMGLLLILISTVLAALAVRREQRSEGPGGALGGGSFILVALLLVGYLVAIWAMTTKPT